MASIIKRCDCGDWDECPHPWVVRYRTDGGRASRQREQSFGDDLREAENFLLKVEHDKKAHVFIDPEGRAGALPRRGRGLARPAPRRGQQHRDLPVGAPRPRVPRDRGTADPARSAGRTSRRSSPRCTARACPRAGSAARTWSSTRCSTRRSATRSSPSRPAPTSRSPASSTRPTSSCPPDDELEALAAGLPGGLGRDGLADVRLRAADRRGARGQDPLPDQPGHHPAGPGAGQPGRAAAAAEVPGRGPVPRHPAAAVRVARRSTSTSPATAPPTTGTCSRGASTST